MIDQPGIPARCELLPMQSLETRRGTDEVREIRLEIRASPQHTLETRI